MAEAAAIYLQEFAVLEQARDELYRELDELWTLVWDEVRPQADDMAKAYGRNAELWPNGSAPGHYRLRPVHPTAATRTTKLAVDIRDPRESETPGVYQVSLSLAQAAQREILRDVADAPEHMEGLAVAEGVKPSLQWGRNPLLTVEVRVDPAGMSQTKAQVADAVCQLFRVVTDFDRWQAKAGKR